MQDEYDLCVCVCMAYQEYDKGSKKIQVIICAVKTLVSIAHARPHNRYDVDLFGSWNIHMHAFKHTYVGVHTRIPTHIHTQRLACKRIQ